MQRRNFFQGSAAVAATALGGCAATGSQQARTPFSVPGTYIPVAGSDQVFPVRRI